MPAVRSRPWHGVIDAYRDRLPVGADTPVITLHEGGTPLLPAPALSARTGCDVYLKIEGLNDAAINEVIEFIATKAHSAAHIGGYDNTGWDLVSNTIGAPSLRFCIAVTFPNDPSISEWLLMGVSTPASTAGEVGFRRKSKSPAS